MSSKPKPAPKPSNPAPTGNPGTKDGGPKPSTIFPTGNPGTRGNKGNGK